MSNTAANETKQQFEDVSRPEDMCNRCGEEPWEVQFDGENLCRPCRDKAVAEVSR